MSSAARAGGSLWTLGQSAPVACVLGRVLRLTVKAAPLAGAPPFLVSAEGVFVVSTQVHQPANQTANVGAGNWKGTGMWAWMLFRISGLVLVVYLFVHVWVISTGRLGGPSQLNHLFSFFDRPLLVLLDVTLVAAVLYHALNGVRIVLMDVGYGVKNHKAVFWVCMLVAVAILSLFAYKASTFIL